MVSPCSGSKCYILLGFLQSCGHGCINFNVHNAQLAEITLCEIWRSGVHSELHSDQAITHWTLQLGISLYVKQNLVLYVLNDVASYCIHNVNLLTVHSMWDQNSAPIMIRLAEQRGLQHPDVARNVDFASCSCCCCLQYIHSCMCLFTLWTWTMASGEELKCFDVYVRSHLHALTQFSLSAFLSSRHGCDMGTLQDFCSVCWMWQSS
jgi:hypothetical protein